MGDQGEETGVEEHNSNDSGREGELLMCMAASKTGSVKQLPSLLSLQLSLCVFVVWLTSPLTVQGSVRRNGSDNSHPSSHCRCLLNPTTPLPFHSPPFSTTQQAC